VFPVGAGGGGGGAVVGGGGGGGGAVVVVGGAVVVVVGASVVVVVGGSVVVVVDGSTVTSRDGSIRGRAGVAVEGGADVDGVVSVASTTSTASAEDRSGRFSRTTIGRASMLIPIATAARRRSIDARHDGASASGARCFGRGRSAGAVGKRRGRYEARAGAATRAQHS
jgi:hypothetical protein